MKAWFEVDRKGLEKILAHRGKEFAIFELIQNAWDEPGVTRVDVTIAAAAQRGYSRVRVADDAPGGFQNLTHAYTLFAESNKKGNAEQRGRFNLGEKLVLALAREAKVVSTTGGFRFDASGRHTIRERRERGSEFSAILRIDKCERDSVLSQVRRLIPPAGIATTINGESLGIDTPLEEFEATLPTVTSDREGKLVSSRRKTKVRVFGVNAVAPAAIYEMGIPVAEFDGGYRLDVCQKIPLTMDRENVLGGFRRALATAAFNALHHRMSDKDMDAPWVKEALASPDISSQATSKFLKMKFGDKIVSHDPSDREANKLATAAGYTVLSGGTFTSEIWDNVRATHLVKPAGQVTPSKKVWTGSGDPNAHPYPPIPENEWTNAMTQVADYAHRVARAVLGEEINVTFVATRHMLAAASYGHEPVVGGSLCFNKLRLGADWFNLDANRLGIDALLVHELGHHFESDHLSESYYHALTSIAAKFLAAVRTGTL